QHLGEFLLERVGEREDGGEYADEDQEQKPEESGDTERAAEDGAEHALARRAGLRRRVGHWRRAFGLRAALMRSTSSVTMMTSVPVTTTTPCATAASRLVMAVTMSCPIPGNANTLSTTIAPLSTTMNWKLSVVVIGIAALRRM